MTTPSVTPTWPPPRDPIRHSWRCARRDDITTTIQLDEATGQVRTIRRCQGCGHEAEVKP